MQTRKSHCTKEASLHTGSQSGDLYRKYQVSQWELNDGQSLVYVVYRTEQGIVPPLRQRGSPNGRQEVSEETIPGRARRDLNLLHCVDPRAEDTQLIQRPSNIDWLVVTESTWLRTRQRWELVQLDWRHQPANPSTTPTTCRAIPMSPPSKTLLTNGQRVAADVLLLMC